MSEIVSTSKGKNKKVLHVTSTYFPDTHGGVEEVIRQICLNTKPHGIESRVFTLSPNPFPQTIKIEGCDVFRAKKSFEIASCRFSIEAISKYKELIEWADIIHYHFPWPFADFLHLLCKVSKKSIVTYHSDVVRQKNLNKLYTPVMHYFLKSMNKIITTSLNYSQSSKILKEYKDKVEIIPIGLNEKSYPVPSKNEIDLTQSKVGNDFILFVGMFRNYKGLNYLLKSAQDISTNIVLVGKGPLEKELKNIVNNLRLSNIQFLGEVNEVEKVALFKLCRAVVLPSHLRSEAFGVTLIEGSMYGKPLISTEIGTGTSYINLNGKTGIVVPPRDSKSLKNAIIKISSDLSLSKKMGHSSRLRYEELFTGQTMGQKYLTLYNAL
mgnify:CR=1 FL=1